MPRGKHLPYAYICTDCDHMAHSHGLAEDGDLRAGPYVCEHCGCSQPQDGAFAPMTRRQYEAWADA